MEQAKVKNRPNPNIMKQLEQIASEICDHYCKFPDEYFQEDAGYDASTEKLVEERCTLCLLVQFLSN